MKIEEGLDADNDEEVKNKLLLYEHALKKFNEFIE